MKIIQYSMLLFLCTLWVSLVHSQTITGKVFEKNKKGEINYLPGVNIYWAETTTGTTSDVNGDFEIVSPESFPAQLVFSYVGYKSDTIPVKNEEPLKVELKNAIELKEVEVVAKLQTTQFSTITPINVETITGKELQKAACCNLSESFETNASVDVNFTDAVSGAKQIQMLGLDGVYTQMLSENFPAIRGLSSAYGLGYVPGTWVESIQITKGTGSVVNGYESITGQINVEFLKPENTHKLFVNSYASDASRYEGNVHFANTFNDKWSTLLFTHASTVNQKNDNNDDTFLDTPLLTQYNIFNRWKYDNDGKFMAQLGVKALIEERQGGQINFNYNNDFGTKNNYGIGINTKQLEAFSKTAIGFEEQPYKSLGLISNVRRHEQRSFFGLKQYDGEENTLYFNLVYQTIISNTDHKFKTGASYLSDNYKETFNDSLFNRNESVPGIFAEYNYDKTSKFSFLSGVRADYHNLYGLLINPRMHLKFNLMPLTVLRFSAGRGLKVANVFAENSAVLASSRQVVVKEKLLPEIAWNYGVSLTHKFQIKEREAIINTDFYRTDFINQVVVDADQDVDHVYFYNLTGKSYSNSFQAEFAFEPVKSLNLKAAYKWYDVRSTYNGTLLQRPMVSRDRVLFNAAYATRFDKWKFDFTAKWFGKSRLPNTSENLSEFRLNPFSEDYFTFNSQVTRAFKHFDIYLGGENLSNFKQYNAIIAANDPFGTNFDASMIWGPLMGRVIYVGFRYIIK